MNPPTAFSWQDLEISSVIETRLSGLVLHSMILSSLALLPVLKRIPMPVISGVFLYLGRKVMSGNSFLQRLKVILQDSASLPASSPVKILGRRPVAIYTGIQVSAHILRVG